MEITLGHTCRWHATTEKYNLLDNLHCQYFFWGRQRILSFIYHLLYHMPLNNSMTLTFA